MFSMVVIIPVNDFSVLDSSLSVLRFVNCVFEFTNQGCFSQFSCFESKLFNRVFYSQFSAQADLSLTASLDLFYFSDWTSINPSLNSPSISLKQSPYICLVQIVSGMWCRHKCRLRNGAYKRWRCQVNRQRLVHRWSISGANKSSSAGKKQGQNRKTRLIRGYD